MAPLKMPIASPSPVQAVFSEISRTGHWIAVLGRGLKGSQLRKRGRSMCSFCIESHRNLPPQFRFWSVSMSWECFAEKGGTPKRWVLWGAPHKTCQNIIFISFLQDKIYPHPSGDRTPTMVLSMPNMTG